MSDRTIQAPARPAFSVRMSARDLLNVAIFAVIYFVVVYAIALLGIINPLVMMLTLPLSIIVAGQRSRRGLGPNQ
jgi:energy-coupling factor transport system substrate-specific component